MLEFHIQFNQDAPLYQQLYEYIKHDIQSGMLEAGTRLPSIQYLSRQLQISKTTVETAYDQLLAEGYIRSKPRSGYYVEDLNTAFFSQSIPLPQKKDTAFHGNPRNFRIDFNDNHIDQEHFPLSVWRRLYNQSLQEQDAYFYGDPQGEWGLRHEIVKYIRQIRGIQCTEEQIIIGANSQHLIGLLCKMLKNDTETVGMEEPGYHVVTRVFKDEGFHVFPIPIQNDGIDVSVIRSAHPDIVFTSPSHHYPFGMVMPIQKRIELLEWAEKEGGYIIEDDILSEFRYSGQPIPALKSLDKKDRVIYMGTFFKTLLPSLRIGYLVLPEILANHYREHFHVYQQTTSRIDQNTLERFMKNGHWEQHIRKMRKVYQGKYETIVEAVKTFMKDHAEIIGHPAGLHILLHIKSITNEEELEKRAGEKGIKVYRISESWFKKENNFLNGSVFLLGFGGLKKEEIVRGIQELSEIWFGNGE
ncbi:MAG: PLP-dependent aminotransferase family protein [Bacillaceae bacterium]|nr:PLP-dependent aminotransferase family protein [Bacillaceae bacterium]